MRLSRYTLKNVNAGIVAVPEEALFKLPEKVLQFGTGVLLRGLPDYFIDKANRQGMFNGRIVVVKSTSQGDTSAFEKQDNLYTLCIRGIENGQKVEENSINASISKVLNAQDEWQQVLECAHNQSMQIIISNTTEVGIQLIPEDIRHHPPKSFPGKLLAFLYERFQAFNGSERSGMVIVPTELIPENGRKLESIVFELAHLNGLEERFIDWLEQSNYFCNSLVDRIVPGKPEAGTLARLEQELGYSDQLLAISEVYRLWAIEGGEYVKNILTFAQADRGVVIKENIDMYRELKLRLLNGTHTLSCGLAVLSGCHSVKEAMEDNLLCNFIARIMQEEIAPAIPYSVDASVAHTFSEKVLDRFRNSFIIHEWINITMQYSSKMKMRCVPVLLQHYTMHDTPPELFATGFAAYLLFLRPVKLEDHAYYGEWQGSSYLIKDDMAKVFYARWKELKLDEVIRTTLGDVEFWGADLNALPGFTISVTEKVNSMLQRGVRATIEEVQTKRIYV